MTIAGPKTGAEALLMRLKQHGIDYLFANAGTDFAPIIEAFASGKARGLPMPEPLVMPHETAAVAMAHGHYLATGKPQAVMVHVNVGLANAVMGVINAASDNIPIFVLAGRTPLTEHHRLGARMTPIQYGQEMRDQAGMVRELTKWDYELRYAEQAAALVDRGVAIAMSEPRGPVYLGLPREPLAEAWPADQPLDKVPAATPAIAYPDPGAIAEAAGWLKDAENPLVICQRGDLEGRLSDALGSLADAQGWPVVEFWPVRNVLASRHPMHGGYDVTPWVKDADVILVLDAKVPWIQSRVQPGPDTKVIHIGPDPLFPGMPVRSFATDLAITGNTAAAVKALSIALGSPDPAAARRHDAIVKRNQARYEAERIKAQSGSGAPMSAAYVSRCLSDIMDERAVLFGELGATPDAMDLQGPNRCILPTYSGGLGWGLPAALGAALADRDRLVIACVGDGSYTFANPVVCHQIAEALALPVLTIVMNNGVWNAVRRGARGLYPEGYAAQSNEMPLTSLAPSPDYAQVAGASRAWSTQVESGGDLPAVLETALDVIRTERRQVLLDVRVSV